MSDGNVGGLFKNVAHGAANSAAKVTGSLSAGLGKATLDERYDERRLMLRRRRGDKNKEHLVAGLKGLGFGVLGGLTSVITEPIEGAASDGVQGFFSGDFNCSWIQTNGSSLFETLLKSTTTRLHTFESRTIKSNIV